MTNPILSIRFTDFNLTPNSIDLLFEEINVEAFITPPSPLYFHFNTDIPPNPNLIALALATLCGTKYQSIYIDLNINHTVLSIIQKFTQADVTSKESSAQFSPTKGAAHILNFSGGFDSLSARAVMPKDTQLISMNFGGALSREEKFFKMFSPYTVTTNLYDYKLRFNCWAFMGIGSILYSEHLGTKYHTFGGILEGSPSHIVRLAKSTMPFEFPLFHGAGLLNAPYVSGLTEIGTLKILYHFCPELINASLKSLANPNEPKSYRKYVLTQLVGKDFPTTPITPIPQPEKPRLHFGQSLPPDYLSFYMIKRGGLDLSSHVISDIPKEVVDLAQTLSLDFFGKYNPNAFEAMPDSLKPALLERLGECSIDFYNTNDWEEFYTIQKLLSRYYKTL